MKKKIYIEQTNKQKMQSKFFLCYIISINRIDVLKTVCVIQIFNKSILLHIMYITTHCNSLNNYNDRSIIILNIR